MIYQAELVIPANTLQSEPYFVDFTLPKGVITRLAILFPFGCAGLVHVQIFHNEWQAWPTTRDKSFIGDDTHLAFTENYVLGDAWNFIRVVGWNNDDSYEHTVNVWIEEHPVESLSWAMSVLGQPRYVEVT
jgi:hypothetical protein